MKTEMKGEILGQNKEKLLSVVYLSIFLHMVQI